MSIITRKLTVGNRNTFKIIAKTVIYHTAIIDDNLLVIRDTIGVFFIRKKDIKAQRLTQVYGLTVLFII